MERPQGFWETQVKVNKVAPLKGYGGALQCSKFKKIEEQVCAIALPKDKAVVYCDTQKNIGDNCFYVTPRSELKLRKLEGDKAYDFTCTPKGKDLFVCSNARLATGPAPDTVIPRVTATIQVETPKVSASYTTDRPPQTSGASQTSSTNQTSGATGAM